MERAERRALRLLLLELFSPNELRQFVNKNFPKDVDRAVPWRGSQSEIVSEVIRVLESRGYIDEFLRDELIKERPRRAQEILQAWDAGGAGAEGPAGARSKRPETTAPTRSRMSCLGVGAAIVVVGTLAVAAMTFWGDSNQRASGDRPASRDVQSPGVRDGKGAVAPKLSVSPHAGEGAVVGHCPQGMSYIAAGTFRMGSEEGRDHEKPVRQVSVEAFCLGQSEVSIQRYAQCRICSEPHETIKLHYRLDDWLQGYFDQQCSRRRQGYGQHPVTCVDWTQAKTYCQSLGRRLPTEREWEYAARGPEGRRYPWGDSAPSALLINACGIECEELVRKGRPPMFSAPDGAPTTAQVRSFPEGRTPRTDLYHLAGNVWEWTQSGYSERYDQERSRTYYVVRGGSWSSWIPADVRAAYRQAAKLTDRLPSLGFRCAADPI